MNAADLTLPEKALLVHAHRMGGWLSASRPSDEHEVMGDLVRYELFELVGEGAQRRYALTVAGAQVAEQLEAGR